MHKCNTKGMNNYYDSAIDEGVVSQFSLTRSKICLARSANLPEGLHILPSVSFFFLYIIFFNDFSETNYLNIHRTDFRNLYIK